MILNVLKIGVFICVGIFVLYKLYCLATDENYRNFMDQLYSKTGLVLDASEKIKEEKCNQIIFILVIVYFAIEICLSFIRIKD